jgi:hypothetical protein
MNGLLRGFFPMFVAVVVIQGIHVVEHIIQLAQVYLFDVPDDDALGVLGYFLEFQGTEEWLHLGFNAIFFLALAVLAVPMLRYVPGVIPPWAFAVFLVGAVGLEAWHVVEHSVIIANVIENSGCPCPGIGDRALDVTDTQLHFVYNAAAYAATVVPFWFLSAGARSRWQPAMAA